MRLTQKQEGFTQDLFAEVTQRQAYKNHYNTVDMLPATIDRAAHELASLPKVTARLEGLRAITASKTVMTLERRLERLTEFAEENIQTKEGNLIRHGNIAAIDLINKVEHLYETGGNIRDVNVVFIVGKGYQELPEGREVNKDATK